MPRLIRSCLLALSVSMLVIFAITALWLSNDRNWTALLDGIGVINDGGRFGIRIGDTEARVRSRLARAGLRFEEKNSDVNCVINRLDRSSVMEVYSDSSWRNGVVCVGYRNDLVSQIGWFYTVFP